MKDLSRNDGLEVKAHAYNVNCVSFGKQCKTKFFTTSLDGTVREGDINSNEIRLVSSFEIIKFLEHFCGEHRKQLQ